METTNGTDEITIHTNTPTENSVNKTPLKRATKESVDKECIILPTRHISHGCQQKYHSTHNNQHTKTSGLWNRLAAQTGDQTEYSRDPRPTEFDQWQQGLIISYFWDY